MDLIQEMNTYLIVTEDGREISDPKEIEEYLKNNPIKPIEKSYGTIKTYRIQMSDGLTITLPEGIYIDREQIMQEALEEAQRINEEYECQE